MSSSKKTSARRGSKEAVPSTTKEEREREKRRKERAKWSVGRFADEHYKARKAVEEAEEIVKTLKAVRDEIGEDALECLSRQEIDGARGKLATCFVQETEHFNLSDRPAFERYVKRTGNLHLFQGRVSAAAVREIMAQNKEVPGVTIFPKIEFRSRKLG